MSEFNTFEYRIPWPTLKEWLEGQIELDLDIALNGEGVQRDKASGRVQAYRAMLNLPNILDILEKGEKEDGSGESGRQEEEGSTEEA